MDGVNVRESRTLKVSCLASLTNRGYTWTAHAYGLWTGGLIIVLGYVHVLLYSRCKQSGYDGHGAHPYPQLPSDVYATSTRHTPYPNQDGFLLRRYSLEMATGGIPPANVTSCVGDADVTAHELLPAELRFNKDSIMPVVAYSILFVIGAVGNCSVFVTLYRNRRRRSRVNRFIMHLALADMIVVFIMMPLEISWHLSVSWLAGDFLCRLLMFFRAFGFYLSSFILIMISLDRYFAVRHPLTLNDSGRRGKCMLVIAWTLSTIASIPQSIIFHVESHPVHGHFQQCVTFNFFPAPSHELAYNLFNIIAIYGLPLIIIIISYTLILVKISRRAHDASDEQLSASHASLGFSQWDMRGRPHNERIHKAKLRMLKMTIVIVLVFIICWTPYFVMSCWWWFDRHSAERINTQVQKGLFLFAVSNSCMNPFIYGMFTTVFQRSFKRRISCVVSVCLGRDRAFGLRRARNANIVYGPYA